MVLSEVGTEQVVARLSAAGCVAAGEEAGELIAAAPDVSTLDAWLGRRERGEPLAWITDSMQFCGRTVHVEPSVYVPRVQSEELARRAAALLPDGGSAVDLCTGSGAIAVHLAAEVPTATVIGVDVDIRAVRCARRNGVRALVADLARPIPERGEFDLVTAVAPYVPTGQLRLLPPDVQRYETRAALDGGEDGLDLVRRVIAAAGRLLRRDGWMLIELGGRQDEDLMSELVASGFARPEPWWDDDGDLRGLAAQAIGTTTGRR